MCAKKPLQCLPLSTFLLIPLHPKLQKFYNPCRRYPYISSINMPNILSPSPASIPTSQMKYMGIFDMDCRIYPYISSINMPNILSPSPASIPTSQMKLTTEMWSLTHNCCDEYL